ncbi:MAG: hypothetical protein SVC26_08570 [Pseudomonadota bacterium]|nr:hypothetical protein [Pseudomonadota bacterium]
MLKADLNQKRLINLAFAVTALAVAGLLFCWWFFQSHGVGITAGVGLVLLTQLLEIVRLVLVPKGADPMKRVSYLVKAKTLKWSIILVACLWLFSSPPSWWDGDQHNKDFLIGIALQLLMYFLAVFALKRKI